MTAVFRGSTPALRDSAFSVDRIPTVYDYTLGPEPFEGLGIIFDSGLLCVCACVPRMTKGCLLDASAARKFGLDIGEGIVSITVHSVQVQSEVERINSPSQSPAASPPALGPVQDSSIHPFILRSLPCPKLTLSLAPGDDQRHHVLVDLCVVQAVCRARPSSHAVSLSDSHHRPCG